MQNSKVAWLESQYLYPQHFQQQERYFEYLLQQRCAAIEPNAWGFHELTVDPAALAQGRIALLSARGILPDGTPFDLPHTGPLPTAITVPKGTRQTRLHLVLARYQPGSQYLDVNASATLDRVVRYRLRMVDVFDYAAEHAVAESIETASPNFALALDVEDLGGYSTLPVAEVREVTAEGAVILESSFMPAVVRVSGSASLLADVADLLGLIRQRGEALAARFNQVGGNSAIADFLLLQLLNRYEPRLAHIAAATHVHPERLFSELLGLMGELATFTTAGKRPEAALTYQHDDLRGCFTPLLDRLRGYLSAVLEQTAVRLPVEQRKFGIHVAHIGDRSLLRQANFVLAARADLPTEVLSDQLASAIKVGTVESIRDLVNNQLPGIGLSLLPVAPREIPFHAGSIYFQLDAGSELWSQLRSSGGFAFHVGGELPRFALELWAIRR